MDVLNKTDELSNILDTVVVNTNFGRSGLGRQLQMVAKLMLSNEIRSVNRDVFLVTNVSLLSSFVEITEISQPKSQD